MGVAEVLVKTENVVSADRSCSTCHSSWVLPPTGKELKDGVIDDQVYCCHSVVKFELNGQIFPRLSSRARERSDLCGTKGRLWQPIKVMIARNFDANGMSLTHERLNQNQNQRPVHRMGPTTLSEHKNRQQHQQAIQTQQRQQQRTRKPYTV